MNRKRFKSIGVVLAIVLACGLLMHFAFDVGESRFTHKVVRFPFPIPIPALHESYSGTAFWLNDSEVKTQLSPITAPQTHSRDYFLCLGSIRPKGAIFYVLEINGSLYLEKEDYIKPLIAAMVSLSLGQQYDPKLEAAEVEDLVAKIPNDPELLKSLVKRFSKP